MTLKDQITEDMKSAMRARQSERLGAIRLLLAAVKQKEVDERIVLDDGQVLAIIEKLVKQRKDSITQFQAAQRDDLVQKEQAELSLLQGYLPKQAGADEVAAEIDAAIAAAGAKGPADMGKVMGPLRSRLAGKADLAAVSALVKARLAGAADRA